MTEREWLQLIEKYARDGHRMPFDVRTDMGRLIAHCTELSQRVQKLNAEVVGATQTVLALCMAAGSIEIPFALIDRIRPGDRLRVEDAHTAFGTVKRFSYVRGPAKK